MPSSLKIIASDAVVLGEDLESFGLETFKKLPLKATHIGVDFFDREVFFLKKLSHRTESIQSGRIKRRAEESRGVSFSASTGATGREAFVFGERPERGRRADVERPSVEAFWNGHEANRVSGLSILVAAGEEENTILPSGERDRKSKKPVVTVDHRRDAFGDGAEDFFDIDPTSAVKKNMAEINEIGGVLANGRSEAILKSRERLGRDPVNADSIEFGEAIELLLEALKLAVSRKDREAIEGMKTREQALDEFVRVGSEGDVARVGEAEDLGDLGLSFGNDVSKEVLPLVFAKTRGVVPVAQHRVASNIGPEVVAVCSKMIPRSATLKSRGSRSLRMGLEAGLDEFGVEALVHIFNRVACLSLEARGGFALEILK